MGALFGALKSEAILNPYIELTKSSATQDLNAGVKDTVIYISWDSQTNVDTGFTHSTSTNNTRITIAETGIYDIYCTLLAANGGTNRFGGRLLTRIDGTTVNEKGGRGDYSRGAAYNDVLTPAISTIRSITASSYIEIGFIVSARDQATAVNTENANCQLIIRRIR